MNEAGLFLKQQTMHPLRHFNLIFPSHRLVRVADELRYRFVSDDLANIYERVARKIILAKGLPLVAHVETWQSGGVVREIAMVVKEVPEMDIVERNCPDEVQDDEGLSGGWWN